MYRTRTSARPASSSDPDRPPFDSFFERERQRRGRSRSRLKIILISVAVHVVVFSILITVSMMQVDELFGDSVGVTLVGGKVDLEAELVTGEDKKNKVAHTSVQRVAGLGLHAAAGEPAAVVVTGPGLADEPSAPGPGAVRDYLQRLVRGHLVGAVRYPEEARSQGLRATVTLRLAVARTGDIIEATVRAPCPHDALCAEALRAARAVGHLPPHDGTQGDPWLISVPIEFSP